MMEEDGLESGGDGELEFVFIFDDEAEEHIRAAFPKRLASW